MIVSSDRKGVADTGKAKANMLLKKSMTKKAMRELNKSRRGMNGFNTGTRVFRDGHTYTRCKRVVCED